MMDHFVSPFILTQLPHAQLYMENAMISLENTLKVSLVAKSYL